MQASDIRVQRPSQCRYGASRMVLEPHVMGPLGYPASRAFPVRFPAVRLQNDFAAPTNVLHVLYVLMNLPQ